MPTLADVITALDEWYDPRTAESWDAVGLVCGDPADGVAHVLVAVDLVPSTVDEALEIGAQMVLTHHPLLLTGVHGVPASDPKGALVHRMIRHGVAHFVAHTNADVARPGVSDALADRVGLHDTTPLVPDSGEAFDKLVVFVPRDDAEQMIDALAAAGAGHIRDYERCAWTTAGAGTFRPLPGANPALGRVGDVERVDETRVEMVVPSRMRGDVVRALRAAHPYEEPAFDLLVLAPLGGDTGTGRVGELATPTTLRDLTGLAARRLPATVWGVRAAGDPDRPVRRVAVCGGSGGSFSHAARSAGADAYLTADLKHHATVEAVTERGPDAMGLVDAAHWATEAPWLDVVADRLRARFASAGLRVTVSMRRTDPWTLHVPSTESSPAAS